MSDNLPERPEYRETMKRLAEQRQSRSDVPEYWRAREIMPTLGYERWENFEGIIGRAWYALSNNGVAPSQHIAEATKMVEVGSDAKRRVRDYFLSRLACYLIAMNGDPSKPEIAAAQAYFVIRTRESELAEEQSQDDKRLELRQKVSVSFKTVSGIAKQAGVPNSKQGFFHGARYQGLYGMSATDLKRAKGLSADVNPFDHMGALELSANNFQMNLAAETIEKENIRGAHRTIEKNRDIAQRVRKTMIDSGSSPPELLPAAEPIHEVMKRAKASPSKRLTKTSNASERPS